MRPTTPGSKRGATQPGGRLALRLRRLGLWKVLGWSSFEGYCSERLGLSAWNLRQRIWLERRLERLPPLREALRARRINYAKALVLARRCDTSSNEAAIEAAIDAAKKAVLDAGRPPLGPGGALAEISRHFREVWEQLRPRISAKRRRVLARHEGLCATPGCSRSAVHLHHLRYRSRGGDNTEQNLVGLCAAHHLRGVHAGRLKIRVRAGSGEGHPGVRGAGSGGAGSVHPEQEHNDLESADQTSAGADRIGTKSADRKSAGPDGAEAPAPQHADPRDTGSARGHEPGPTLEWALGLRRGQPLQVFRTETGGEDDPQAAL